MFYFQYLAHQWKSVVRSPMVHSIWLVALTLLGVLSALMPIIHLFAKSVYSSMCEQWGLSENLQSLHLYFAMFWVTDLLIKQMISPAAFIRRPYHLLPLPRSQQVAAFLTSSVFKMMNWVVLLFQLPVLYFLANKYSEWNGMAFFALSVAVIWLANHFVATAYQLARGKSKVVLAVVALLFGAVAFWLLALQAQSSMLAPLPFAIPYLIAGIGMAGWAAQAYLKNTELEDTGTTPELFSRLPLFGSPWARVEWALIMRNKRTRSNLLGGLLIIPYMIYVFQKSDAGTLPENPVLPLFLGILFTGFMMLQHGIYTLGWEGNYFDLLVTRLSVREWLEFKYRFYTLVTLVPGALVVPMAFWQPQFVGFILLGMLYNIGWNLPLVLFNSVKNTSKLDLSSGSAFNLQGFNLSAVLVSLLIIIVPLVAYGLCIWLVPEPFALVAFGAFSLVGVLLRPFFLEKIHQRIVRRKYHLAECYKS